MAVLEADDDDIDRTTQRIYVDVQGWRELNNSTFRSHFRMDRVVFEKLIVAFGNHLTAMGRLQRLRTPLDLCLLMALWPIFNQDTFRSAGAHFGVDKGVTHFHYRYVILALREMAPKYIKWPSALERDRIKTSYERNFGYPGVVGCMDGVHIEITAPPRQGQRYVNRHGDHSILVQAVCDDRLLYRDVYAGQPGSIGDLRMFERSPLANNILLREDMFSRGEHLLADGAYPLMDKIIIPYVRDRNNTPRQKTHNRILSAARASIERSFSLLRGKNRRLKKLPMRNIAYMVDHITTCFVLHNFILLDGCEADGLPAQPMPVAGNLDDLVEEARGLGAIKREQIAQILHP